LISYAFLVILSCAAVTPKPPIKACPQHTTTVMSSTSFVFVGELAFDEEAQRLEELDLAPYL